VTTLESEYVIPNHASDCFLRMRPEAEVWFHRSFAA